MSKFRSRVTVRGNMVFGIFFIVAFLVLGVVLSMWLVPYNINTWLGWAGKPPAVKAWHGALIGLVPAIGEILVPISVLTWVVGLFL